MNNSIPDERFEVWDWLSTFFLDTSLDKNDYERVATSLARSEYSIEELRDILDFEVAPACRSNLMCLAGEWAGFHPDWIMENIAPRKNKRPRSFLGISCKSMVRSRHWKRVAKLIEEKRTRI